MPATSSKVVEEVSLVTILALDLPKLMTPLPPPPIELRRNQNSAKIIISGRSDPRMANSQGVEGTSSVQPSLIGELATISATVSALPETK